MYQENYYTWVGNISPFWFVVFGVITLVINFIPSFVAFSRQHPSRIAILILDALFGWTIFGWLILLIWAMDRPRALGV